MNKRFSVGEVLLVASLMVAASGVSFFVKWQYGLVAAVVVLAVWFFYHFPRLGLYAITFLYPLTYLEVVWQDWNAPYVDVLAMIVFTAWFAHAAVDHILGRKKITAAQFPGLFFFVLFIIASSLSLVYTSSIGLSIKYLLRPLSFFYLMFVILPYNLIGSRQTLKRVMAIFYGLGLAVAVMGLISLFVTDQSGFFRRVMPIAIGSFHPLGWNHNLIAEVLVSVIPFGVLLYWQAKEELARRWLVVGTLLMVAVTLLTFSRTGWLTLIVEFILLLTVHYRHHWKRILAYGTLVGILLSPMIIYMYLFSTSYIAESSNFHRLYLTRIALQSWQNHPFVGNGAGTFTWLVGDDPIFLYEFGDVQESHGVIQKLLAESGLIGLATFSALLLYVVWRITVAYYAAVGQADYYDEVIIVCLMVAIGAIFFQLFDTSYFVSKMWYPLGVALAATKFVGARYEKD